MKPCTEQSYKECVLRALVYIQRHLDEAIELTDLARVAHFSPYHFHRLFRGIVGESVMEHVRRLRLERAAQRLKLTGEPVTRIAFEAGYETHEAFSRAFRTMFGQSPSQFRATRRPLLVPAVSSRVHFTADGTVEDFEPNCQRDALDIRVERIDPLRVAFIRHVGPYDQVGAAWGRLMSWAAQLDLLRERPKSGPRSLGLVLDDPDVTAPEKLRYDACLVIKDCRAADGEVGIQEISGGDFAVATHRGPYDELGNTYARFLGQWLPANGREPKSAPAFEVYRNAPADTAPADLLTEIYLPLSEP
jgi:AraC family transcriptional regulator